MARARERGQAVPLLTIVLMLAALAAVVVAEIGVAAVERSRAQTAADAAALAGAAEGRPAADAAATANGATLIDYAEAGRRVEVEVHYRRARARAAAESAATGLSTSSGGGDRDGLAPAVAAALARADQLLGRPVPVVSGFRSRAEQQALWDARASNPFPVAPPGTSRHESGLAIDVPSGFVATLLAVAADAGLCQPLPETDPVHFEPCPPIRT